MNCSHRRRALAISSALASVSISSAAFACKDHSSPLCLCPNPTADHTHDDPQAVLQPLTRGGGGGLGVLATTRVWVFSFDYSTNMSFGPIVDATINAGDTIRWEWEQTGFHTVTSVAGSQQNFNSGGLFNAGSTYFQTFNTPGVYTYYCTLHGFDNGNGTADGMAGTITVVPSTISSSWNVDFDGSWNTASNWTGNAIPNGAGHSATFGPNITAPRGVTVDSPVTVGSLTFNTTPPRFYNIGGSSTINLSQAAGGGDAVVRVQAGQHGMAAKLQPVSNTVFQIDAGARLIATQFQSTGANLTKTGAGSLVVNRVDTSGSLAINEGTVRTLSATSRVGSLTINTAAPNLGTLDLIDQDLIVQNGSYATITGLIAASRNGGEWDKPGITAAAAPFATPRNTTLGTLTGAQLLGLGVTTFGGFDVAAWDILVKYTYYGDTDFNGQVNFDDYARIDNGFNNGGNEWIEGDFDYSGGVNFDDYALIDLAFNTQSGTLIRAMDYLEGEDRSMRGMNDPALQKVVDHFAQFGNGYATSFLSAVPEPTSTLIFGGVQALACMRMRRRRAELSN